MAEKTSGLPDGFYGGLSGLVLPVPKYQFPPEHRDSSRLTYYATFFNSIEINSSFYKLPLAKTVAKWRDQVPEHFSFTFKLWKEITHVKNLAFKEPDIASFFSAISHAEHKKGCVLIQLPPATGKGDLVRMNALLAAVKTCNPNGEWKIAVEFRNPSWYEPEVYDMLETYNAAMVIQDIPRSATPLTDQTADFMYLRFHGPTGNYRDSYSEHFLAEYASYIHEWLREGKIVFAYFNNTMGDAFKNMETLKISVADAGK